jgi:hypothetical protein
MLLANVALPSFIGHGIVFIILLPLVATIEAIVLARLLRIDPLESLVTSAQANWRSTIADYRKRPEDNNQRPQVEPNQGSSQV